MHLARFDIFHVWMFWVLAGLHEKHHEPTPHLVGAETDQTRNKKTPYKTGMGMSFTTFKANIEARTMTWTFRFDN